MSRSNLVLLLFPLVLLGNAACVTPSAVSHEGLAESVNGYHQSLRWKRLDSAAQYRLVEERAEFLARYLAVEDDLNIDTLEVRGVTFLPDSEPIAADVVVTAEAVLLPSNVLEKFVITERWELRDDTWRMVKTTRELAPAVRTAAVDMTTPSR